MIKKIIILFGLFCFILTKSYTQRYFAKYLQTGTSLTFIWDNVKDEFEYNNGYKELTWNVNIGIPIHQYLFN